MKRKICLLLVLVLMASFVVLPKASVATASTTAAPTPDLLHLDVLTGTNQVTTGPAVITTGNPSVTKDVSTGMDMVTVNSSNYYTANMYFDSNTSNTPNTSYNDLVDSFSMEVYFTLPETVSATGYIAKFMHWNGGVGLQVAKDGENLKLQGVWGNSKTVVGDAPVEAGKTYHAVLTWSLSSNTNTVELFVDGVKMASANGSGNMMTEGAGGGRTLTIGDGVGGKIGIYNMYYTALNEAEVSALYNVNVASKFVAPTPDLLHLDVLTGTNQVTTGPAVITTGNPSVTKDVSTGMDMVTVNSSNYYTANMYFDSNTSNTPNTSYNDLVDSFSMEVYFTLPETVSATGYIAKFMHWNGGVGLQVAKDGENLKLQGVWGNSKTVVGDAPVEAGKTYHAVLTWSLSSNTNTVELFVDGVKMASANGSGNMMTEGAGGGRTLTIGDGVGGKIGIFNMYYTALTQRDVTALYNQNVDSTKVRISQVAPELAEAITLHYTAHVSPEYTGEVRMKFLFNEEEIWAPVTKIDASTYDFTLNQILPQDMAKEIDAFLYVDDVLMDEVEDYSVKKYCERMLTNTSGDSDEAIALRRLLVAILNYGAESEQYFEGVADGVADDGLDAAMKAYLSNYDMAQAEGVVATPVQGERNDNYLWKAATLGCYDTMQIRVKFLATDVANTKIQVMGTIYTAEDFISIGNNQYYLYVQGIPAAHFATVVTAVFLDSDDQPIGQSLTYSVNTYINYISSHGSVDVIDLVQAIYNYGCAAYDYYMVINA